MKTVNKSFCYGAYVECLNSILSFYDMHTDFVGVLDNAPINKQEFSRNDLFIIADKLGFIIKEEKRTFSNISALGIPVILALKGGECFSYLPDAGSNGRFIVPNAVCGDELSIDSLSKSYMGICYTLIPKSKDSGIDISHMSAGHKLDWFWSPIVSFWGRYAEVILCTLFINLLAFSIPLFTLNVYDRVVINFVEETLIVLTMGVITALIFDFLFKMLRYHILERIAVKVSSEYDVKLMERMLSIKDVNFLLTTGEKSNLFRELQGIKDFYASRLVPTVVDLPFFFLFVLVIYNICPQIALIPVVAASLIFIINFLSQPIISRHTAQYFSSMQNKSAYLVEMLSGLSTIKMLGGNGNKLYKWKQVTQGAARTSAYNAMVGTVVSSTSVLVTQVAQICLVFYGAYYIHEGSLTVGGLVACTIIYGRSIAPVVTMATVLSRLKQSKDVLKTIDKIFKLPHDDFSLNANIGSKGPFDGRVSIRDVSYQYHGQSHPALYKVNLIVEPGEHVGLLGKTGAGKSTLSQVIAGAISPAEGSIHLDSYAYSAVAETELRRSIGYVPQNGFFFSGSMRDNIIMGDDSISHEDLERSIHMAGLDLVIQQTSEGLDMDVGEGGKRLSGGQRQAISLARAFARNPSILVFDEPTNGMDNSLEDRIRKTISEFIKGKTFIMVTHRTTLLPLVSRLVLLDKGRVIADGARDEIIRKLSN